MDTKLTHVCEKCGRGFDKKSQYTAHMNRKTPCVTDENIKKIEEKAVLKKMIELGLANNNLSNDILVKPILKWVGGKTQIIETIMSRFPKKMNHYREMFLGGGSVLLALLSYKKSGRIEIDGNIYAYDLNEPLIYLYKNIQSNPKALYDAVQELIQDLNSCPYDGVLNRTPATIEDAIQMKENYYYWIRTKYNQLDANDKKTINGSAMFLFLNKTCFRGVFRVGPRGFNVPYGHYKNPEIINEAHLMSIHELIQPVIFECCGFETSLDTVEDGDFAYLDPPYAPETNTSFVGYTENGFNAENHNMLFKKIISLEHKNAKWMMSNSDVDIVHSHFGNDKYDVFRIQCKRSINSKTPDSKTNEVIITNYNQN